MELTKKEREIREMADWIEQVGDLLKNTSIPENIEIDHEDDYILYGVDWADEDWSRVDFLMEAEDLYEAGCRLVSTKTEKIPDLFGTGYALKLDETLVE